jgi:PTH1 family peptidyl-tRNA hydrolase
MTIQLIVGLGNPGEKYIKTRHNVGFWWIDTIAQKLGFNFSYHKNTKSHLARGDLNTKVPIKPLYLLKPQTYMNLSGQSVANFIRFYKIPIEHVLVAHDDLDILPGRLKLKQGGGNAGHNGLKDIDTQLKSKNYWRLRIGIGHPGLSNQVSQWVLQKPTPTEQKLIQDAISTSTETLPELLSLEVQKAQSHLHNIKPETVLF